MSRRTRSSRPPGSGYTARTTPPCTATSSCGSGGWRHQRGLRHGLHGLPKWGLQSWFNDLYPGDDVVDWIAETRTRSASPHLARRLRRHGQPARRVEPGPASTAGRPPSPRQAHHARRVGRHGDPNDAMAEGRTSSTPCRPTSSTYPAIKALVYWNSAGYPTRIDSTPQSLTAYQQLADNPFYNQQLP